MKAKDVARQINDAVEQRGICDRWEAVHAMADRDAAALEAARRIETDLLEAALDPATDYLAHLIKALGTDLHERNVVKAASVRAAVLAAEQAWKAFHARLLPLPARYIDPEGFRRTLEKQVPGISALAWSKRAPASTGRAWPFR